RLWRKIKLVARHVIDVHSRTVTGALAACEVHNLLVMEQVCKQVRIDCLALRKHYEFSRTRSRKLRTMNLVEIRPHPPIEHISILEKSAVTLHVTEFCGSGQLHAVRRNAVHSNKRKV